MDFTIPSDTFVHTDPQAEVSLSAMMIDGAPLPGWMAFDAVTGTFTGKPPGDFYGELQIKVIARDDAGRQAETIVRVYGQPPRIGRMDDSGIAATGIDTGGSEFLAGAIYSLQILDEPADIITTSGFPVLVTDHMDIGHGHELRVDKGIPDQTFASDGRFILYVVPTDAFVHTDSTAEVTLFASMIDGSELPAWLLFDSKKGEFEGVPPLGFEGELLIKVIARDDAGRQAETIVSIRISVDVRDLSLRGNPGLTEQLQDSGIFAWKDQRDKLVRQAREAAKTAKDN